MPSLNRASILVADDRSSGRYRLLLEASAAEAGEAGSSVTLHDLSQTGLLFEAAADLEGDAEIMLDIPGIGPVVAQTVWTNGRFYGAQFAAPLSPDRFKAALAASKVVWPEFAPAPPLDIEQARAPKAPAEIAEPPALVLISETPAIDQASRTTEEPKLPLPVRIRIIVGASVALWSAIAAGAWLAFG